MIIDETFGRLNEVKAFADKTGQRANLDQSLSYLDSYACNDGRQTKCVLLKDFAPMSFEFVMYLKREDEPDSAYKRWFNGGLIYHGPHDGFGSGSAPSFSCCISPTDGWSVHT